MSTSCISANPAEKYRMRGIMHDLLISDVYYMQPIKSAGKKLIL